MMTLNTNRGPIVIHDNNAMAVPDSLLKDMKEKEREEDDSDSGENVHRP